MQEDNTLRRQMTTGAGWVAGAQLGRQSLQFLISVILARLLTPQDFGLLGLTLIFANFATLLAELGFGSVLIQRPDIDERLSSTLFWLNIFAGFLLALLVVILAPLIAQFYGEPILTPISRFVGVNLFITSFSTVQRALFIREMNFRIIASAEIVSLIVGGGVAIMMAIASFGVWSLVVQLLVTSLITVVVLWTRSTWSPKMTFSRQAVMDIFGYSSNLLGFNVVNYWSRNADYLLIGKYFGAYDLGIYTRAYILMLLPLQQVSFVLTKVMFPSLSRIQHDKPRVKRIYLKSLSLIALITFPMMIGLAIVADDFVFAFFGSQWIAVIPLLRIFSLLGMAQSLMTTVGWIYQSQGRTDWMFRWGMFASALSLVSFIIGIWFGTITSVAISYTVLMIGVLMYPAFAIPGKLIGMKFEDVVHSVIGILGCAFLMAIIVWLVGLSLPEAWTGWIALGIQTTTGIVAYVGLIHIFKIDAYLMMISLIIEYLPEQMGNVLWKKPGGVDVSDIDDWA